MGFHSLVRFCFEVVPDDFDVYDARFHLTSHLRFDHGADTSGSWSVVSIMVLSATRGDNTIFHMDLRNSQSHIKMINICSHTVTMYMNAFCVSLIYSTSFCDSFM